MDKFLMNVGRLAIAGFFIECALIADEWRKQAKIDTERKKEKQNADDVTIDILEELDALRERLSNLELK